MNDETIICNKCGVAHGELPDIGSDAPFHWADELINKIDCLLTEDLCIIENRDYFIRGVIQIPITGTTEYFGWGVWLSQKKENYLNYKDNDETTKIGPYSGWLCTKIDYYKEDTLHLKAESHFSGGKDRPFIKLWPTNHELFKNQNNGITLDEAWEIVHYYIGKQKPDSSS